MLAGNTVADVYAIHTLPVIVGCVYAPCSIIVGWPTFVIDDLFNLVPVRANDAAMIRHTGWPNDTVMIRHTGPPNAQ